jgi:hypothetical protein
MTQAQIKAIQQRIGATPDGFWGPKSIAACQRHLRSLMPSPNPWPKTDQASLTRFYGSPGDESKLVNLPVAGMGVRYDGIAVRTIRCHSKVADSLLRVLQAMAEEFPEILAQYAGCYNNRNMRGGSLPSLHARGAAIDFAPATNGLHTPWPTRATMPFGVMEIFAREGWKAAGAFWGRDAMHLEASA